MSIIYINPYQFAAFDPDALTYINAVETADGQALETGVRIAINDFVLGCKQDGIWNAIKASCIMAGARTLSGALVPLVGTAPTNFNFVSGDYDRETGLVGDASTKYLITNFLSNGTPLNSVHLSAYASSASSYGSGSFLYPTFVGTGGDSDAQTIGVSSIGSNSIYARSRSSSFVTFGAGSANATGFVGTSRSNSSSVVIRASNSTLSFLLNSSGALNEAYGVFRNGAFETTQSYSNARLAFYSIGESLDLAVLDTRVSNLITAIGAAIP